MIRIVENVIASLIAAIIVGMVTLRVGHKVNAKINADVRSSFALLDIAREQHRIADAQVTRLKLVRKRDLPRPSVLTEDESRFLERGREAVESMKQDAARHGAKCVVDRIYSGASSALDPEKCSGAWR